MIAQPRDLLVYVVLRLGLGFSRWFGIPEVLAVFRGFLWSPESMMDGRAGSAGLPCVHGQT